MTHRLRKEFLIESDRYLNDHLDNCVKFSILLIFSPFYEQQNKFDISMVLDLNTIFLLCEYYPQILMSYLFII